MFELLVEKKKGKEGRSRVTSNKQRQPLLLGARGRAGKEEEFVKARAKTTRKESAA